MQAKKIIHIGNCASFDNKEKCNCGATKRTKKYLEAILAYHADTSNGLWCIDRNPAKVDIDSIIKK